MEQPPKIFGGAQPQFNDSGVLEGTSVSSFMSTVFTWMVAGLAVTAAAAVPTNTQLPGHSGCASAARHSCIVFASA